MIRLIFVGKTKENWLKEQISEYEKRISRFANIQIDEIKDEKIFGADHESIKRKEGERIISITKDDFIIALDENGKSMESEEFAQSLKKATEQNRRITFVVGGALGLSHDVLKKSEFKLSLSKMTLTNQMVRLMLIEQIYRAFTILAGMEYHK